MPTYVYECSGCQHRFELIQSISDEHKAACPECGEPANLIPSWSGSFYWDNPKPLYHKDGSYEEKY